MRITLAKSQAVSDQLVCLKWHFIRSTELEFWKLTNFLGVQCESCNLVLRHQFCGSIKPKEKVWIFATKLEYFSVRACTTDPSHSGHCEVLVFKARFRGRAALLLFSAVTSDALLEVTQNMFRDPACKNMQGSALHGSLTKNWYVLLCPMLHFELRVHRLRCCQGDDRVTGKPS